MVGGAPHELFEPYCDKYGLPASLYGCNIACTTVSENEEFPKERRLVRVPLGQSACIKRLVDWDHALFIEI